MSIRKFYKISIASSKEILLIFAFFFLTGITRFSKVSLFSDLNNLTDLSFEPAFHNLLGYTQAELEKEFQIHLSYLAQNQNISLDDLLKKIKVWYNGYSWNGKERVYNPFSILLFLGNGQFMNFWFESGTPRFLIKQIKEKMFYDLSKMSSTMAGFNKFDIDNPNLVTLLFPNRLFDHFAPRRNRKLYFGLS